MSTAAVTSPQTLTSAKPRLSFWQIWNMSFGFLGIQFGFALQNANTSRIFETLGADTVNLALYWLAAPITGLIVQPIIGYHSDRTWHKTWGRRRPFFAVGALLASVPLCLMPNSPTLWMAVGVLWIMDASINISLEPFRAFVGDMLPAEQRTRGFAMQSFFIGIGAIVASFLPWIFTNWFQISNTAEAGIIPDSVKYSFYIGAFMLFATVMWTYSAQKNIFMVIPQIIAGTVLGYLLNKMFNGEPIYILVTGGVSMIIAGLLCLVVDDSEEIAVAR